MPRTLRLFALGFLVCFALGAGMAPAYAKSHKAHHVAHHSHKAQKHSTAKSHLRQAQTWLNDLGYKVGKADGVMGKRTRAALKAFQRDQQLRVTGTLTDKTYKRLAEAAGKNAPPETTSLAAANAGPAPIPAPDYYGHVDPAYSDPLAMGSPQPIPTRFGDVQISGEGEGAARKYAITLNGETVYHAENQPAPMAVSQTFALPDVDLVLLTAYDAGNITCAYKHHLLALRANSHHLYEISRQCSQTAKAHIADGSLLIDFPAADGPGAMWRYENGLLVKL